MSDFAFTPEGAAAFLQSTQRLRCLWSSTITNHNGYAIVLISAVWGYFLKAHSDCAAPGQQFDFANPLLAAAVSGVALGLWRLYSHYLDDRIAGLYADLMLCEEVLRVPADLGTIAYLERETSSLNRLSAAELKPEQKRAAVKNLHLQKRLGARGQRAFDLVASFLLLLFLVVFVWSLFLCSAQAPGWARVWALTGILTGVVLTACSVLCFQRKPSAEVLDEVISEVRKAKPV